MQPWYDGVMRPRKVIVWALVLSGCGLLAFLMFPRSPPPQDNSRLTFEIVTGAGGGSNARIAAMIAGLISNPPGIGRCSRPELCGPAGLIGTTRATQGAVANIRAVDAEDTDSAIAEANVIARAVAGEEPFRNTERARSVRAIASLYGEDIHIVAARRAEILGVNDLRNKRVSLSPEGTATIIAARAVLRAYRLAEWRLVRSYDPVDRAAALMREGELDAFFFIGGTPVNLVSQLLEDDIAVLVPIDGEARMRLLAEEPEMVARAVPIGTYPGSPSVETVGVRAVWITHAAKPDALVHAMVRALYHPENRPLLESQRTGFDDFDLESAAENLPAPLHPGAARYFTEMR